MPVVRALPQDMEQLYSVSFKIQTCNSQENAIVSKLKTVEEAGNSFNSSKGVTLCPEELEIQWRGRRQIYSFVSLLVWVLSQSLLSGFSVLF